jgi:ubiquinone/menaquinone biosynthesis C-methylase UbiE
MYPLDLSWKGLEYARSMGVQELVQGNLAALPYRGESFDVAISLDVIIHFPPGGESSALRELARVVVPGGWSYCESPHSTFFGAATQSLHMSGSALPETAWSERQRRPVSKCFAALTPTPY